MFISPRRSELNAIRRPSGDQAPRLSTRDVVSSADGRLSGFDQVTGKPVGQVVLEGVPQRGLRIQGTRAFVQVRRAKTKTVPAHDVLLAVSVGSMSLLWEFVDKGVAPGLPGVDGAAIAWPAAGGEVVLFR